MGWVELSCCGKPVQKVEGTSSHAFSTDYMHAFLSHLVVRPMGPATETLRSQADGRKLTILLNVSSDCDYNSSLCRLLFVHEVPVSTAASLDFGSGGNEKETRDASGGRLQTRRGTT